MPTPHKRYFKQCIIAQNWKETAEGYQLKGSNKIVRNKAAGLIFPPGLSKTSTVLDAFVRLKKANKVDTLLVVAPSRVCEFVWPEEVCKWKEFNHLKVTLLEGGKRDSVYEQSEGTDIYCVSNDYRILDWLFNETGFLKENGKMMLVVDESQRFKNSTANRSKALNPHLGKFCKRVISTGTPRPNGVIDLFGQIYILDIGEALGRFITHYRMDYFHYNEKSFTYHPLKGAEEAIYKKIKHLLFVVREEDAPNLNLPEIIYEPIKISLSTKAQKIYEKMELSKIINLKGVTITAANAAVVTQKCRQIANGGIYSDKPGESVEVHSDKVRALKELLEDLKGQQVIVFYEFHHDLARLKKALGKNTPYIDGGVKGAKLAKILDDWHSKKTMVLLAQPEAAGTGLNLQHSQAQHVIWFSMIWDFEVFEQAIKRIRRRGNLSKWVFVHCLLAADTIDEIMYRVLKTKGAGQKGLFDALSFYIKAKRNAKKAK